MRKRVKFNLIVSTVNDFFVFINWELFCGDLEIVKEWNIRLDLFLFHFLGNQTVREHIRILFVFFDVTSSFNIFFFCGLWVRLWVFQFIRSLCILHKNGV